MCLSLQCANMNDLNFVYRASSLKMAVPWHSSCMPTRHGYRLSVANKVILSSRG